eukprot:2664094-Pyramimonas_sp.AAC.1
MGTMTSSGSSSFLGQDLLLVSSRSLSTREQRLPAQQRRPVLGNIAIDVVQPGRGNPCGASYVVQSSA